MGAFSSHFRLLFGKSPGDRDLTVFFSARLDEAGTDGLSPNVLVAGGVAIQGGWDELEDRWSRLLASRGVKEFHTKEFKDRNRDFDGWGRLRCKNFVRAQEKIIKNALAFTVAVGVEKETHTRIKEEMRGTRGFKADSDFGFCFRVARFFVCDQIARVHPDARVQFLVEDGPFAADAGVIYQDIRRTQNAKYRPAMHANMLGGFASIPKGRLRSLEAADYLAGRAIADIEAGTFTMPGRPNQVSMLMDEEFLRMWHQDMLKEKAHRKAHAAKRLSQKASRSS